MSPNASGFLVGCAVIGIATITLTGTDPEPPTRAPDAAAFVQPEPQAPLNVSTRPTLSSAQIDEPTPVASVPAPTGPVPGEPEDGAPASSELAQAELANTEVAPTTDDANNHAAERDSTAGAGGLTESTFAAPSGPSDAPPDRADTSDAAASTDGSAQTERFWGPFNVELRANSFASHLEKLIDHPVLVQRDDDGYYIAFAYTTDDQRRQLRNRISAAGLEPK